MAANIVTESIYHLKEAGWFEGATLWRVWT